MKRVLSRNVQRRYFIIFLYLPEIVCLLTILFFFIYGIIDANTAYIDIPSGLISYGIFGFQSKFATWLLWFVIGIIGSLVDWLFFRITLSPIAMLVMNGDKEYFDSKEETKVQNSIPCSQPISQENRLDERKIGEQNQDSAFHPAETSPKPETRTIKKDDLAEYIEEKKNIDSKSSLAPTSNLNLEKDAFGFMKYWSRVYVDSFQGDSPSIIMPSKDDKGNPVFGIFSGAFLNCGQLEQIELPQELKDIGENAFSGCRKLQSIYIPLSVQKIGSQAFKGCTNLIIHCAASSKPAGWDSKWNCDNCKVEWGVSQ